VEIPLPLFFFLFFSMMKGDDQVIKNKTSATEHDSSIKLDLNTRLTKKVKSSWKRKEK